MVGIIDVVCWLLPFTLGVGIPWYERLALWRGRDGLGQYVERGNDWIDRDYLAVLERDRPSSLMTRIAQQLGRDLKSVTLLFIVFFVLQIIAGAVTGDSSQLGIGIGIACLYVVMFASTLRTVDQVQGNTTLFEATLVDIKPPVFLAYSMATLTTANRTIKTGVRWRTVEALRRREVPIAILFAGTPDKPSFVGMRKL